ncbi:arylamine N-acetyltransferase [Leptolyngbya sp. GB1-A1]|uniref:arylamine N-acetyltransferase family protein n=1 Tax=Leptolyngbya sp. GB1-A1 TaxID=2933908 RepID=UPI003296C7FC
MEQTFAPVNLDAYFQRIGYRNNANGFSLENNYAPTLDTLKAIHQRHPAVIPFENLNPLLQQPVRLDLPSLQQKLLEQGRGGYCFEQNLLLRSVLIALGFRVTSLAARVRWNIPEGTMMPRTHMLLLVDIDEQPYIADVGFGGLTLTAPLRLVPDIEQSTSHEPFRFIADNHTYTMQAKLGEAWKPLYTFDLQEQHLPDYEVSNWYVASHPDSLFVNHLIVARPDIDCRYSLRNNQLSTHYLNGQTEQRVLKTIDELRTVLEDIFRLTLPAIDSLDRTLQQIVNPVNKL